jgi:hypothetical protein
MRPVGETIAGVGLVSPVGRFQGCIEGAARVQAAVSAITCKPISIEWVQRVLNMVIPVT